MNNIIQNIAVGTTRGKVVHLVAETVWQVGGQAVMAGLIAGTLWITGLLGPKGQEAAIALTGMALLAACHFGFLQMGGNFKDELVEGLGGTGAAKFLEEIFGPLISRSLLVSVPIAAIAIAAAFVWGGPLLGGAVTFANLCLAWGLLMFCSSISMDKLDIEVADRRLR